MATIKALTSNRFDRPDDAAFQIGVYAQRLEDWPADVVRKILADWPTTSPHWPAWFDLEQRMEPFVRKRKSLAAFLQAQLEVPRT